MRIPVYRTARILIAALSFILFLSATWFWKGYEGFYAGQIGSDLLKIAAGRFTVGVLVASAVIVVLTLLFGRFYCSVVCPLGILQDFLMIFKRRFGKQKSYRILRYSVFGFVIAALLGGFILPLALLLVLLLLRVPEAVVVLQKGPLEPGQLEVWDIVNVFRPMSESPEKIIKLMGELEGFARQKVTGLINNSNLLNYASADDLRQGYDILREVSDRTGIPVVHTTGRKRNLEEFLKDGRDPKYIGVPMALETYMHRGWDTFSHGKI